LTSGGRSLRLDAHQAALGQGSVGGIHGDWSWEVSQGASAGSGGQRLEAEAASQSLQFLEAGPGGSRRSPQRAGSGGQHLEAELIFHSRSS